MKKKQREKPEDLLARIRQRDAAAMGELYDQLAPHLQGILQKVLASRPAAEEVLEDAFCQLWNVSRRMRETPASVAAWMLFTSRSAAVERLRRERDLPARNRHRPIPLGENLSWLPPAESVSQLVQRQKLLKNLIAQLPPHQLLALELLVFEGFTEAEIAGKLGEPLGKTRSTLRASLAFLRHRLRAVMGTWAANI